MKKTIDKFLADNSACGDAKLWAKGKTWEEIFTTCHRGDWLLWLFKKTNPNDLQKLTLAKGHCVETVLHLMKGERSKNAVNVAIAFGEGEATREDLNAAAYAAYAAADAVYAAAAAAAAAYAAYAAADADSADAAAAYAADAAADAADAADAAAARTKNRLATADICRKYLPIEIWNILFDENIQPKEVGATA